MAHSPHDPAAWLEAMRAAGTGTARANMTVIRRLRVAVQQETVEEVNRNGDRAAQTLCHRAGEPFDPVEMPQVDRSSTPEECCPPMVRVVQGDCLEQARLMLDAGARRVAVLNMANPRTPGLAPISWPPFANAPAF